VEEGVVELQPAVEAGARETVAEAVLQLGKSKEAVEAVQLVPHNALRQVPQRQPVDLELPSRLILIQMARWKDRARQNMSYHRRLLNQ